MSDRVLHAVLGWYEVIAGVAGVILTAAITPSLVQQTGSVARWRVLALLGAMASAFAVVALAGVLLLQRRRFGKALSVLVQVAQIPLWAVGTFKWTFFAGAYLALLVSRAPSASRLLLGISSRLDFAWGGAPAASAVVGVNFAPFAVLFLLGRLQRPGEPEAVSDAASVELCGESLPSSPVA
jgi:hypothetical protein